jgi:hypothetical protein
MSLAKILGVEGSKENLWVGGCQKFSKMYTAGLWKSLGLAIKFKNTIFWPNFPILRGDAALWGHFGPDPN